MCNILQIEHEGAYAEDTFHDLDGLLIPTLDKL
jgi:hypothetical protein